MVGQVETIAKAQTPIHEEDVALDHTLGMEPPAPVTPYLIYLVLVAALGPLQFGYHLGELNAPQKVITCQLQDVPTVAFYTNLTLPQCIHMDPSQWGLVQSIFTMGGLCGALLGGPISTTRGRLFAMKAITVVLLLGPLAESFAPGFKTILLGRFISGIGAGAATVVSPIYISEISPDQKRGLFGALTQVMINGGILSAQLLGYFLSRENLWRIILGIPGILAGVTYLALLFAPETPTWLAEHRRTEVAKEALQHLRSPNESTIAETLYWSEFGETEVAPLLGQRPATSVAKANGVTFFDVVRIPKYRKAIIAVTTTMMAQQLTGINSVVMYSVSTLGTIIPSAAALVTVIVSAINVFVTLVCAPLADRIGRKPCLLISTAGMGMNSVLLAIALSQGLPALSVVATLLFVCFFGVGLGPVPFILASELVDAEAVGATSSWALAGNWISTFCVAQFFPILNASLAKGQVYWIFAGLAALLGLFIAWYLPESKGKSDPDRIWAGQ